MPVSVIVPVRNEGYQPGPTCFGECCLPDGTCVVTGQIDCEVDQCGIFVPTDGDCETSPPVCLPRTGACCTPAGDCLADADECECLGLGGDYRGDGEDCPIGECPPPIGVSINEFDYDNVGPDSAEFIELIGPPGFDLNNWSVVRRKPGSRKKSLAIGQAHRRLSAR